MINPVCRNQVLQGDVLEKLKELPDDCIDVVVTSPPYWGLRDYGDSKQIGLEKHPCESCPAWHGWCCTLVSGWCEKEQKEIHL